MNTDADTTQIPLPMGTMCVNAFNAYMSQFASQLANSAGIDSFLLPVFVKAQPELKKTSAAAPKEKPLIKLPWDGKNHEDQCQALVYNGGLYTQCPKARGADEFCKTCAKQVYINNGVAPHGHIDERMAVDPMEFKPRDASKPLKYYANVVGLGSKTSEAQVREQLERFGVRAEDWMFLKAPSSRGKKATKVKTANKAENDQDAQIDSLLATVAKDAAPTPPKVSPPKVAAKTSTPYNSDDIDDDDYDVDDDDDDREYPHWMTHTDMDEYNDWEFRVDAKGGKYDVNTRTHKVYKVDTHEEVKLFAYKNEDGLKITKTKKK